MARGPRGALPPEFLRDLNRLREAAARVEKTPLRGALRLPLEVRRRLKIALPALRPRVLAENTRLYVADRRARRLYRELSEEELLATRRTDCVFVLGSGKSILEMSSREWELISRFDVVSFSHFLRQQFVRADYHVVGEIGREFDRYATWVRENPLYRETIYILQEGWIAASSNALVASGALLRGARVFRYRRTARAVLAPPTTRFRDGLTHGWNSSFDATNFALLMGWKRIVLVGIDLYDAEHFWLPRGVARLDGAYVIPTNSPFNMAEQVVAMYEIWKQRAATAGVALCVYNSRSLLAQVLDVFEWGAES